MNTTKTAASSRRRGQWPPKPGTTVNDIIPNYLDDIDRALTDMNVAIAQRPVRAASMFVKHYVKAIRGDTKDEYYIKPWFASIFATVHRWYREKYGEDFDRREPGFPAIVVIHDWPYLLEVELTHSKPGDEPETMWLSFEVTLGKDEMPRTWIKGVPNLKALLPRQSVRLDRDLARTTEQIRMLHIQLLTAKSGGADFDELRNISILALRNAAEHIRTNTSHSLALAMWDLNYALENAFKALIDQAGGKYSRVHNLEQLLQEAADAGRRPFPKAALAFMPNAKRAIDHRYGKGVPGGLQAVIRAYRLALDRLVRIGARIERHMQVEQAQFLLKKPPWTSMLPELKRDATEAPV